MTGVIKNLNAEKGYGFIRPEGPGKDLFFHHRDFDGGRREFDRLAEGDRVEFSETESERGPRAEDVRLV